MYAEILLLRKLPKSIDYFDYLVPADLRKKIKIGQAVEIPFRRKVLRGVVLNLKKTTNFKNTKSILKITEKEPLLTENQLLLAKFVSEYYYTSISTVVRQIIPPPLKRPRPAKIKKEIFIKTAPDKKLEALTKKVISSPVKKHLFTYLDEEKKLIFYLTLIDYYFRKNRSVVLLFPEIIDLNKFYVRLPLKYREKTALIHHRQAKSEIFHAFSRIKSGQAKIILGTPLVVFSPFKKPGLVIIDQEESSGHKQSDQNPRFSAKKVAEKLSEISRTKVIFSSAVPAIDTFFRVQKGDFSLTSSGEKNKVQVETARAANYSGQIFSDTLIKKIYKALNQNKKTLLFVSRKGFSRALNCLDCGHTFSCSSCRIPFVLHEKEEKFYLFCHRCGQKREMPLICPLCRGSNLKNVGLGTEKVRSEASRLFPGKKILLVEPPLAENADFSQSEIIISTQAIFKKINWQEVGLIGLIDTDALLNLPDYRSQEKTFQLLTKILSYLQTNKNSEMLIQAFSPDKAPLKYFPEKYLPFYRQELKIRKQFSYPPFARLIKISSQHEKAFLSKADAEKIREQMLEKNLSSSIIVSPVLPAFIFRRLGRYYHQIILKILPKAREKEVSVLINLVPDGFLIDVDPENLL